MTDTAAAKKRLREYLEKRGVKIVKKTLRCPNPSHHDEHPSAHLYDERVFCPVCSESWDVFAVAGLLDGTSDFTRQVESVTRVLGLPAPAPRRGTGKKSGDPIPLKLDAAREIYTMSAIDGKAAEKGWGKRVAHWTYTDTNGDVVAMDVRYEGEGKKTMITWWYDGALKWYGAPVFVYGIPAALATDKPVLIHEGCKCAETAAQAMPEFYHVAWSGGSGKAHLADWSMFRDREVYMYPDDDEPGQKAAAKIREQLPALRVAVPVPAAREIKPQGADIVEALQVMDASALAAYIMESPGVEPGNPPPDTTPRISPPSGPGSTPGDFSDAPFRVLGEADDGYAYFIDCAGRQKAWKLDGLNERKLNVLAPLEYWQSNYTVYDDKGRGRMSWTWALDTITRYAQARAYDPTNVRGRGCWRERDGRLCYHDGQYTVGDADTRRTYLKKIRVDIGIGDEPIPASVADAIRETAFQLSFETPADALRCLAWSVLAPFAGGLDWRPSLLITGPSGSGKSTVANQIIRKLAHCLFLNGSESTVAGTRALVGKDSCGIVYDETEADTQKKKLNRDELFSLMRASVSDDAPDTVKGTKEGGFVSYKMQNMFAFIAIDPTVDNVADENRIFRINMVKPTNGDTWRDLEAKLAGLLSDENCRAIRSLTWRSLPLILALARRIAGDLGFRNARGYRTNYADALLAAAYMVVWKGAADPTHEQLSEFYQKFYAHTPPEPVRDDAEELVNLILDQIVEVMHENSREKLSVAEALNRIHFREYDTGDGPRVLTAREIKDIERAIGQMGIRVIDHDNVAIDNCHNRIRDIIQHGRGYAKIFRRHHGWVEGQRMVAFEGRGRRCTIIAGLIGQERDAKFDEQVGVLAL